MLPGSSPLLVKRGAAFRLLGRSFAQVRSDPALWGRWVESAMGAHLVNAATGHRFAVYYWRERGHEVDSVVVHEGRVTAIEVKSGAHAGGLSGLAAFVRRFPQARPLVIGEGGMPLEEPLACDPLDWLGE